MVLLCIPIFHVDRKTNMAAKWQSCSCTLILVIAISQKVFQGCSSYLAGRFLLWSSCACPTFRLIEKQTWPPGGHLVFRTLILVIAISQKVLEGCSSNLVGRFPLLSSCACPTFRLIGKQTWLPGGHLVFRTLILVIAISQKVLEG